MVMRAFLLVGGVNLIIINNIENFIKRKSISIITIYQIDPNLNSKVSALLPGLVNLANTIPAMQAWTGGGEGVLHRVSHLDDHPHDGLEGHY